MKADHRLFKDFKKLNNSKSNEMIVSIISENIISFNVDIFFFAKSNIFYLILIMIDLSACPKAIKSIISCFIDDSFEFENQERVIYFKKATSDRSNAKSHRIYS